MGEFNEPLTLFDALKWNEEGLIPAIVQDAENGDVLIETGHLDGLVLGRMIGREGVDRGPLSRVFRARDRQGEGYGRRLRAGRARDEGGGGVVADDPAGAKGAAAARFVAMNHFAS